MIRSLISYLAAPVLGHIGAAVIHAAREESARADAAELNEARAIGERDEARRNADHEAWTNVHLNAAAQEDGARIELLIREVETLRSEAMSALAEDSNGRDRINLEAATVDLGRAEIRIGQLERERDELQRRCGDLAAKSTDQGAMILALESSEVNAAREIGTLQRANSALETELAVARKQRDGHREASRETQADLDAARAELAALKGGEVAPVDAEKCAWCLGPADDHIVDNYGQTTTPICGRCWSLPTVTVRDVRDRVVTRAASCASRRKVANPIDAACPTCFAPVGDACHRPADAPASSTSADRQ